MLKQIKPLIVLKPCPFCGIKPKLKESLRSQGTCYYIQCNNDDCIVKWHTKNHDSAIEICEVWNRVNKGS